MNFRPRQRDEVGLDLTPLIDVVFLLLLFFMLTTTFVEATRLKIDLPEAGQGAEAERKDDHWTIEIDAQGRYALNGETVVAEQLSERLRAIPGRTEETSVLVRADGQASHQAVVRALDAARSAGIVRVGLATESAPASR
ncbi:MAG TPA: biopolymer transporter ExbD [Chromatiales bacterium]|nr:biopolymer transporter ExbD [Chromatiales bacterium]